MRKSCYYFGNMFLAITKIPYYRLTSLVSFTGVDFLGSVTLPLALSFITSSQTLLLRLAVTRVSW